MESAGVVIHGNVFAHVSDGFASCFVQLISRPFPLETTEEAFNRCIVPAVAFPAHAADHAVLLEQSLIGVASAV